MTDFFAQLRLFSRRYPLAAVSILALLVFGGADYFLWKRKVELSQRAERARLDGEAMLLSLSGQPRIQSQHTFTRDALKTIDANLASESDLAGNLDYFYQIEKTAKIRLSGISQLTTQPGGPDNRYRAIPFSLRLLGPYSQLLAYLHELETGPRLLRVKSYRFSQADPSLDSLSLDLTVEVLGRP